MGSKCFFLKSLTIVAPPPDGLTTDTPPALEPPTQTMFARGPVGGGHSGISPFVYNCPNATHHMGRWAFECSGVRALTPLSFPPCPPHKHNVFVGAPGAGNDRVFVVRWVLYYLADETPGITGMMVPPGLGTGIVAVGL